MQADGRRETNYSSFADLGASSSALGARDLALGVKGGPAIFGLFPRPFATFAARGFGLRGPRGPAGSGAARRGDFFTGARGGPRVQIRSGSTGGRVDRELERNPRGGGAPGERRRSRIVRRADVGAHADPGSLSSGKNFDSKVPGGGPWSSPPPAFARPLGFCFPTS